MTITINRVIERGELYCRYPRQTSPQPCHIELNCDSEELWASYNGEIGNAVPMNVWHNRALRWTIPALTADAANETMGEILPLAERVVAGYERVWDGSNHVGRYTDDAQAAQAAIEELLGLERPDGSEVKAWSAEDWFENKEWHEVAGRYSITADTTEQELGAIAERVESEEIEPGECDVLEGVLGYLESCQDELRDWEAEQGAGR